MGSIRSVLIECFGATKRQNEKEEEASDPHTFLRALTHTHTLTLLRTPCSLSPLSLSLSLKRRSIFLLPLRPSANTFYDQSFQFANIWQFFVTVPPCFPWQQIFLWLSIFLSLSLGPALYFSFHISQTFTYSVVFIIFSMFLSSNIKMTLISTCLSHSHLS